MPQGLKEDDRIMISAIYKDKGAPGIESIEEKNGTTLRYPKLAAVGNDGFLDANEKANYGKAPFFMKLYRSTSFIMFKDIDLKGIGQIEVNATAFGDLPVYLEIRCDSSKGKLLGRAQLEKSDNGLDFRRQKIQISASSGKRNLYFALSGEGLPAKGRDIGLEWFSFLRGGRI